MIALFRKKRKLVHFEIVLQLKASKKGLNQNQVSFKFNNEFLVQHISDEANISFILINPVAKRNSYLFTFQCLEVSLSLSFLRFLPFHRPLFFTLLSFIELPYTRALLIFPFSLKKKIAKKLRIKTRKKAIFIQCSKSFKKRRAPKQLYSNTEFCGSAKKRGK